MKNILFILLSFSTSFAFAEIKVHSPHSDAIWESVKAIATTENIQLIKNSPGKSFFFLDKMACVFENYNACSFFSDVNGKRKLVVATDGSASLMNELSYVGVPVDEENARMYIDSLECVKDLGSLNCSIKDSLNQIEY